MSQENSFSRDLQVNVSVNQVGFVPNISKKCVVPIEEITEFHVIRLETGEVVYSGKLQISDGDFGRFGVGDFSDVKVPGTYQKLPVAIGKYGK